MKYNIIDIMLYFIAEAFMNEKNDLTEPAPYGDIFEHISDICRAARLCLKPEDRADTDALMSELDNLRRREDMTSEIALPAAIVRARFALSGFEYFCVMLGILSALEGAQSPSFAEAILRYPFAESENVYPAMLSGKPLQYLLDTEDGAGISRRFGLKGFLLGFIVENRITSPDICFKDFPDKLPVLYDGLYKTGVDLVSPSVVGASSCVVINGRTGSGRRTLAAQLCGSLGKKTAAVYAADIKDAEVLSAELTAACVITDSVPVLIADGDVSGAVDIVNLLCDTLPLVFVCVNSEERVRPRGRSCVCLKIPRPDISARLKMWRYYLNGTDIDARILAERYRLTIGEIAGICEKSLPVSSDIKVLTDAILSLNRESSVCTLIRPTFRFEDLVVQEHIAETLRRIVKTAERLPELMEKYGFDRLFPYGRGLGVLFYGASGTGKTMAAYILAAELGLDVMRVDISRIEDKYIGETEKRISEVFSAAEENNCLLFFDEADSLFANRTEVSDSHDRRANAQTAHLLQKMEEYGGIVVLATNLGENIDPAFRRRLHFTLEFLRPDAATRAELWHRFVPEALPHEEIDFGFLADNFELTPAEIKWAALSAAVIADGSPLSARHIISALKYEYEKSGVTFPNIGYKKIELGGEQICMITR